MKKKQQQQQTQTKTYTNQDDQISWESLKLEKKKKYCSHFQFHLKYIFILVRLIVTL